MRDSVPRRATGVAFAAVLLGGGAVGCGDESVKEDSAMLAPSAAVAKAAEKAEDITSLHYRVSGTVPERGRLTAETSMKTKPAAMTMVMTVAGARKPGELDIRFVGKAIYLGGSGVDTAKLGGKSWFKAEPAVWGRGAADNESYGVLPRSMEVSPVVQSTFLAGSKDVRRVGTETVDGTKALHYRGTVTSRELRAAQSAAKGEDTWDARTERVDQFVNLGVDGALTMDLWVDGDDHAKQFRVRAKTYPTQNDTDGGTLDLTVTFLDINPSVTVKTPPAEDTTSLSADPQDG
ncbi:hypothetical protein R6V09_11825 [Streptomyces sp. W16]|uniref:hypothetical protein n=1 Tax=Streptomyces sp. W16 TaxID=3076631 RepID=UPI00295AB4D6|nr:hypothetical protein [Streptomyces sp. W16]MDV9170817.1 hypothetical protein [Streptomyces sp. W16]